MENKELLERFIRDNFDIRHFDIIWKSYWEVLLIDKKGDILTLATIVPNQVFTMINDIRHLKYQLISYDWVVIND